MPQYLPPKYPSSSQKSFLGLLALRPLRAKVPRSRPGLKFPLAPKVSRFSFLSIFQSFFFTTPFDLSVASQEICPGYKKYLVTDDGCLP